VCQHDATEGRHFLANMWMVRAGRGGENVEGFLKHGVVALGDQKLGALSSTTKKEELLRLYAQKYPEMKDGSRQTWASQFLRFISEIKSGDTVVTFDRDRRLYFVGTILSDYEWAPDLIDGFPHVRRIRWTYQVPRDLLAAASRNTLGAIQTLFKIPQDVAKDLEQHQTPVGTTLAAATDEAAVARTVEDETAEELVAAETLEKADEFIEDAIAKLGWEQMQELVAGILRAMGYRTKVSARGADRGVDIFASPDGLGLQEPRIFVEVKHREGTPISADKIRSFLGGRKPGDRCLYVSTGSFTKDARYEAERASMPTTLVDLKDLRKLLVEYYDRLDPPTRALVPLKRLYWPL